MIFSNLRVSRKTFEGYCKHNNLHWARKYARIFVLGHYLLLKSHSFFCSLPGKDNVRGQISKHILALNGGYYSFSSRTVQC